MVDLKSYRRRAEAYLRLAQGVNDPSRKAALLQKAQHWHKLAKSMEQEHAPDPSRGTVEDPADRS